MERRFKSETNGVIERKEGEEDECRHEARERERENCVNSADKE